MYTRADLSIPCSEHTEQGEVELSPRYWDSDFGSDFECDFGAIASGFYARLNSCQSVRASIPSLNSFACRVQLHFLIW